MTVTSQRPLKILIRYSIKTVTFQYIIIFKGKVAIASDSIKSGQLPTKCFGFGKYIYIYICYTLRQLSLGMTHIYILLQYLTYMHRGSDMTYVGMHTNIADSCAPDPDNCAPGPDSCAPDPDNCAPVYMMT